MDLNGEAAKNLKPLAFVQIYNLKENIKEDDLNNLDLFTNYAELAMAESSEKPFQKLLFLVRDWPFATENYYGDAPEVVCKRLAKINEQTPEMHRLRDRIQKSFNKIDAFLMPHPGFAVAHGKITTDDLQQIDLDFITHLKVLVPSILAPQNLIVKKINGQKMRARDFVTYLQIYADTFNSETLPKPESVFLVNINFIEKSKTSVKYPFEH